MEAIVDVTHLSSVRLLTPSQEKAREKCSGGIYFRLGITAGKTIV